MEDINAFEYSKLKIMNERPSKIVSWITILIILFVILLIISLLFKFNIYQNNIGYIDNNYNLRIIINDSSFPISKKYKLYIDNKRYKYKIIKIEKKDRYYELLIKCKLNKELLISNNIITVRFKKGETTLMKELIKKIKKGMV